MYRVIIAILGLFVSAQSIAHSGHDHNDLSSSLIHLLWIAPFILGVFLLIKYVNKHLNGTQIK